MIQTKRANEIAQSRGQKGAKAFNYERDQVAKQAASGSAAAVPLAPIAATAPAAKTRKLSFKEQRELDTLPALIGALEAEQKDINAALADGSLYAIDNARAMKLAARSAQIDDELLAAMERWELLGA
jgi:ATP-binding cassette subfamily F protein uup